MSNFLKKKKEAEKKKEKTVKQTKPTFEDKIGRDEDEEEGIKIVTKKDKLKQNNVEEEEDQKETKPAKCYLQEGDEDHEEKELEVDNTVKIQQVTWDDTKNLDENQVNKNDFTSKVDEPVQSKNTKASWVPQQAKKENMSVGFNDRDAYMPSLGDPDAEQNAPKEEPVQIQRSATSGGPQRPVFTNSKKSNIETPLQLTLQQQKEMEAEEKLGLNKSTSENTGIKFGSGPTRFTNSGATNNNKNLAPLQMTPQQIKEMEMENKLLSTKVYKQAPTEQQQQEVSGNEKVLEFKSAPFKMQGAKKQENANNTPLELTLQQKKELEAEQKLLALKEKAQNSTFQKSEQQTSESSSTDAYKPRFGGAGKVVEKVFKPLEKTEQQLKLEKFESKNNDEAPKEVPETQEQEALGQKPTLRFTNSKKSEAAGFKPLQKTEQQLKLEEIEKQLEQEKQQKKIEQEKRREKKKNINNREEDNQKEKENVEQELKQEGWNLSK